MTRLTQCLRAALLVVVPAASLLLSGCIYRGWPFHRGEPVPDMSRPDTGRTGETTAGGVSTGEGVGWKVVSGKREPHFLIARDGTECMVPKGRWEGAVIGEQVFCSWGRPQS